MEFRLRVPTTSTQEEQRMTVNEVKHQAKLAKWKEHILDCRSQGIPVAKWCEQNGYHRTTYYKWEREIFGQMPRPVSSANQSEFAELPIASPGALALPEADQWAKFEPVAVIRIGKIKLELSNAVSGNLLQQLEGLMGFAE